MRGFAGFAWLLLLVLLGSPALAQGAWKPAPGTTWQWQITGVVDESLDVEMYDIDLFDAAPAGIEIGEGSGVFTEPGLNAGVIGRLHDRGIIVICYVDTGAWENYRPDAALFPEAVKGNSTGWKGERWLDIREESWPLWTHLMWARFDLAVTLGCDGVEPDQNNPARGRERGPGGPGPPVRLRARARRHGDQPDRDLGPLPLPALADPGGRA